MAKYKNTQDLYLKETGAKIDVISSTTSHGQNRITSYTLADGRIVPESAITSQKPKKKKRTQKAVITPVEKVDSDTNNQSVEKIDKKAE